APLGQIFLSYNGVEGISTTPLVYDPGVGPTVAQLQDYLNTIPALTGNVTVLPQNLGNINGRTYTIVLNNALNSQPVSLLGVRSVDQSLGHNVATITTTPP